MSLPRHASKSRFRPFRLAASVFGAAAAFAALGLAPAQAAPTCTGFMTQVSQLTADLHADFRRSLVVTRSKTSDVDYYDLTSDWSIDGTLECRGEKFLRFEAKIAVPANERLGDAYAKIEAAALDAVLGWPPAKSNPVLAGMNRDVDEDLRGSIERGDIFISGKTESHEEGAIDLGLLWTPKDHTFIVVAG